MTKATAIENYFKALKVHSDVSTVANKLLQESFKSNESLKAAKKELADSCGFKGSPVLVKLDENKILRISNSLFGGEIDIQIEEIAK